MAEGFIVIVVQSGSTFLKANLDLAGRMLFYCRLVKGKGLVSIERMINKYKYKLFSYFYMEKNTSRG